MAKIIKMFSVKTVKDYPMFTRDPENDFEDDGSNFKAWLYKGKLKFTVLNSRQYGMYVSVDFDSIAKKSIPYDFYSTYPAYKLCDEFNGGCAEMDLDKFVENCEKILKDAEQMVRDFEAKTFSPDDIKAVKAALTSEIAQHSEILETIKKNLQWWNLNEWKVKEAARYMKNAMNEETRAKELLNEIESGKLSEEKKYDMFNKIQNLKKNGYVSFRMEDDFYTSYLMKYLEESKKSA